VRTAVETAASFGPFFTLQRAPIGVARIYSGLDEREERKAGTHETRGHSTVAMAKKYVAQIDNIYFLTRIGQSLRWATNDIAREELPEDIQRLLRRLERVEIKEARRKGSE
jgi:hypothetical protein